MVNSLWFKWKSLRLPWRKSYLVGMSYFCSCATSSCPSVFWVLISLTLTLPGTDLAGNTFWEFKDAINAGRFRRIVKFDPKTHLGDVKVSRKSGQDAQAA